MIDLLEPVQRIGETRVKRSRRFTPKINMIGVTQHSKVLRHIHFMDFVTGRVPFVGLYQPTIIILIIKVNKPDSGTNP